MASYYLDVGEYALCIEAATNALAGNARAQASVETGAIFGVRGLAKDAQILRKMMQNEIVLQDEILSAIKDLALANEFGYTHKNIIQRIIILQQFLDNSKGKT